MTNKISETEKLENSNKKFKHLSQILFDLTQTTTSHGIPNIFRNENYFLKLFWTACLLCSFGYCTYSLVQCVSEFLNFSVVTQIKVDRQVSIEFPTVSFCNKNGFNVNNEKFLFKPIFLEYKNIFETVLLGDITALMMSLNYVVKYYFKSSNLTQDLMDSQSFNIYDMLVTCSFNNVACYAEDFEHFYSNSYGNCYKFNSGRNITGDPVSLIRTSSPGRRNALRLEIFTGYLTENYDFIRSKGIILFVHNSTDTPLTEVDGVSLSPGFETDAIVDQTIINKQPFPYSNCITDLTSIDSYDSDLFRITVRELKKYSQKFCLQYCFQRYVIQQCGCYDVSSQNYNSSRPCEAEKARDCTYPKYIQFYRSNLSKNCFNECPDECQMIMYNLKLSFSEFPTPFYGNLLVKRQGLTKNKAQNFTSLEKIKASTLAVNVYYDDIMYKIIDESPSKTLIQLISDIGGILGLYIGCSLLSVAEIVEVIFSIIIALIKNRKKSVDIEYFK